MEWYQLFIKIFIGLTVVYGETLIAPPPEHLPDPDPQSEPEPEVNVCTRECNPKDKDVCACIFDGEKLTDNCVRFTSECEMQKTNCFSRPGYQKVKKLSQCPKPTKASKPPKPSKAPKHPKPVEEVNVCTRECNPRKKDVCACIFDGELTDNCKRFTSLCEMEKLNCRVRPGYQRVCLSQCPKPVEDPKPPVDTCTQVCDPSTRDVCACIFDGELTDKCEKFTSLCEMQKLNCLIRPGYQQVEMSSCTN